MLLPDGFIWEEITVTDDLNKELPSIKEQGKNLSKFTFEVVKNAIDVSSDVPLMVSEEKQKERLDICKKCEFFLPRRSRCSQCGCYMIQKVRFGASQCPVNKW
jgi:hypothetical protein